MNGHSVLFGQLIQKLESFLALQNLSRTRVSTLCMPEMDRAGKSL